MTDTRFSSYARFALVYNVFVGLLGAIVRATGSGAGCGADWPTCRGAVIPSNGSLATGIEFAHRATSGLALIVVAVLVVWAVKTRPGGDAARMMAIAAGVLILNEALIGAVLVLFEWVADDESIGRLVSIVIHLVNTFLLLGALVLVVWFAGRRGVPLRPMATGAVRAARLGAVALLVVGAAGAVTALGDTLFPPESVGVGLIDDMGGSFIVRLRWIHPILATLTAGYLLWFARATDPHGTPGLWLQRTVYLQLAVGVLNIALLAPLWMQVVHLLLADVVWISFVLVATQSLVESERISA